MRRFFASRIGFVILLALAAVLATAALGRLARPVATALSYLPYDTWQRVRDQPAIHPAIVLVTRDSETDLRFGTGAIDHAVFARTVAALARAGARVIGIDAALDESHAAGSGALGDAMLIEATRVAGNVVYPVSVTLREPAALLSTPLQHADWPSLTSSGTPPLPRVALVASPLPGLVQHAANLGHRLTTPDPDGTARRVPAYVRFGDRAVPAFGLALAARYLEAPVEGIAIHPRHLVMPASHVTEMRTGHVTIPTDGGGAVILGGLGAGRLGGLASLSLIEVWKAMDRGQGDLLREWVEDKIVVLLTEQSIKERGTLAPPLLVHLDALNTILTRSWMTEAPGALTAFVAWVLAMVGAWLLLTLPGWRGTTALVSVAVTYVGAAFVALSTHHLILPLFLPLGALALSAGGAALSLHTVARRRIETLERRIGDVERDLAAVREDLIARESAVERLEEDLEAARAVASHSAGKEQELVQSFETVRSELATARAEEARSRAQLRVLEQELARMRAVSGGDSVLKDEEDERVRAECERLGILTRDPTLLRLVRDAKKAARSSIPVLLLGEPGTGKELFARAIHLLSGRANGPFVPVNVGAIAGELFESELFGHVKGAFTGAVTDRKGHFQQAHRGTLFLDEIGDLRLDHQGKLLRVLQEQSLYRVGASEPTAVDVRIVAATNKDLLSGIAEGWFREDLYFRLKGVVLRLPPLRERPDDLPLLAQRLIAQAAGRLGRPDVVLSEEAMAALRGHRWPGNIRELAQCLEQAVALAERSILTAADLRLAAAPTPGPLACGGETDGDQDVLASLRHHRFDMQGTARALGCDRSTVTQRLKGLGFRAILDANGDLRQAARTLAGEPLLAETVEWKLRDYYQHLIKTIEPFASAEQAIAACRKRFKNLPDRHFASVEALIRERFRTDR